MGGITYLLSFILIHELLLSSHICNSGKASAWEAPSWSSLDEISHYKLKGVSRKTKPSPSPPKTASTFPSTSTTTISKSTTTMLMLDIILQEIVYLASIDHSYGFLLSLRV
uniref:Uncharacterized protein n=1 Tax=Salix viminalis TaxID=40686 RepID=A0A6N2LX92_SALVM